MRRSLPALAVSAALVLFAHIGCRDKVKELSSSKHLLAKQHELWHRAKESFESDQPNLGFIRSVQIFLRRTRRRVEKDYTGANKQEVLAKLTALGEAYEAEIISRIDPSSFVVQLKPGVTIEHIRAAFAKLDEDYRRLEELTPSK